jgi:hypothetical protein
MKNELGNEGDGELLVSQTVVFVKITQINIQSF